MLRAMAAVAVLTAFPLLAAPTSAECRACHDGTKAVKMENGHPVELDYAKIQRAAPEKYRETPPPDYLVAGRVECSSCHVPHELEAKRDHRLRADVITLCSSCHIVE